MKACRETRGRPWEKGPSKGVRSEDLRSPVLDAMPHPVLVLDDQGRIVLANRASREELGLDCGTAFDQVFPDLWEEALKALEDGTPRYTLPSAPGETRFFARISCIDLPSRNRVVLCDFENSAQLEAVTGRMLSFQHLSRELDAIIDSSYDGLWICNEDGTVIRINRASERLNHLKAEDVVGRHMKDLVAEGLVDCSATLEVLRTRRVVNLLQHTRHGRKLMLTGNPVFDDAGNLILIVVNERDITEIDALYRTLEQEKALKDQYRHQVLEMQLMELRSRQIIARSPAMVNLLRQSLKVSAVDSTVLIQGESGVGKSMIADLIHKCSHRAEQPMIRINCGAIPESLIEAELFGYERGAFTGAQRSGKPGHFELADGGTLFLDEISELPLSSQVKLLRFLEDGRVSRVGGTVSRKLDVRVMAATNRDLQTMVEQGEFRKDLFYRLNVIPLGVPPLRERRECIFPMLQHYLEHFCSKLEKQPLRLGRAAADALIDYDYPGNVRELVNLCERFAVMCERNPIELEDLPQGIVTGKDVPQDSGMEDLEPSSLRELIEKAERRILLQALERYGSQWEAARRLKVNQSTVSRKLKRYGLTKDGRGIGRAMR